MNRLMIENSQIARHDFVFEDGSVWKFDLRPFVGDQNDRSLDNIFFHKFQSRQPFSPFFDALMLVWLYLERDAAAKFHVPRHRQVVELQDVGDAFFKAFGILLGRLEFPTKLDNRDRCEAAVWVHE